MKVYSEAEQVKPNNKALTEQDLFKEGSAAAGQRVEKELIKQIAALMKVETAKVQKPQSLISLGMDSISVVLLKQAIEDFFSCSVEIATLFNSSAAELAEIIVDEISGEKSKETKADLTLPMLIPQIEGDHENFPLTDLQTAYWMGRNEGFELGGVAAHLYMEVTVTNADLDNNRLNQSWQKLIERHPMLRAVITQGGQQRILADNPVYEIVYHDLEHCSSTIQANECEAVRKKLRSQVIPVDTWPWFEIHHSKLSSEKSILHISIDLLIADIWSINLLFKEWYRLYLEPHAPLTELGINFRDFCLALKTLNKTEAYKKSENYWKQRIASLPPAPPLPLSKSPGELKKVEFHNRSYALPINWWENLKERAAHYGITPSIVLMAAFSKILGLWSRAASFSLNLTLFNRLPLHPDMNYLVGDFTSTLVLEVNNAKSLRFAELAISLQKQLAQDMEYRHYSGVNVIRDLAQQWEKSPREAILPVVFTSTLSSDGPMVFKSKKEFFGETKIVSQTPQVWLDHQVYENEDHLLLSWDSVDAVFPINMLDDMFAVYIDFLKELALNPAAWEREIRGLLPEYQQKQRFAYNATQGPLAEELLYSQFVQNACLHPEAVAIITSTRTITYQQLLNSAGYLAGYLKDSGIKPNQLVAVMMHKGWEQIVAVLGITMSGGAYVCVDPGLPQERQHYLLEHSQAKLVLGQKSPEVMPSDIAFHAVDESILEQPGSQIEAEAKPDDLAYVLYTSGSTGLPKGVAITHRNALNTIADINNRFDIIAQDRVLALSSLSFDLSVYDIFGMLHAGAAIVVPDPFTERNPDHWLKMMQRHNVTVWNSVPSLMEMLVETAEAEVREAPLKLVLLSGDWIPVHLPERIWKINQSTKVVSLGGATEASIWSIYYPIDYVDSSWVSIPYGRPLQNQSYYVLNQYHGNCPDWVTGDLYIGGVGVALNYWRDQEKTDKSFLYHPETRERIYKTGDLGRFHPEGYIEFLGREDFQVKIGGFRIELGEIESVLNSHPKVRRAVVKKVVKKDGNVILAAYVVMNTLGNLEQTILSEWNKGDLSSEILNDDESELILDPRQRLVFKLNNPGLRFKEEQKVLKQQGMAPVSLEIPELNLESYARRSSSRRFLDTPLSLQELSRFLACLRKADLDGIKRFRYGSAGGLYPVQAYLYIKEDKVEGLKGGVYYYHPFEHVLIPVSGSEGMSDKVHVYANQAIYNASAFTVFLVGKLSAIKPLYGNRSRDFCLIEAGLITQLLENSSVEHELGLCQIGALADEGQVCKLLALDSDHIILHVLLGGKVDYQDTLRGMQPEMEKETAASASIDFSQELRAYCSQKLPHYMVPSFFTILDKLPLSAVGKVNYKALPEPEDEVATAKDNIRNPSNEMEQLINNILKEELGVSACLDVGRSLFELGLNSLTIVRAWREIIKETGMDFPVVRIFENPTISGLASYLNKMHEQADNAKKQEDMLRDKADKKREALLKRNLRNKMASNK